MLGSEWVGEGVIPGARGWRGRRGGGDGGKGDDLEMRLEGDGGGKEDDKMYQGDCLSLRDGDREVTWRW